jgi:uncharacterized protein (DUF58 family)
MKLRPTALGVRGALFFGTVVLLFSATPYSNLFFLLIAFLASLGSIGIVGCLSNMRGVTAELLAVKSAPAGGDHDIEILVHGGNRTRFGLRIELSTTAGTQVIHAPPVIRGDLQLRGVIRGLARGLHRVSVLRIKSNHPFGICQAQAACAADNEIVAYPPPATLPDNRQIHGGLGLGANAAATSELDSVASLRDFRTGDRLSDVHWKAFARRGRLTVVEREGHGSAGIQLQIDRRMAVARFDEALGQAAAFVMRTAAMHQTVQIRSQGHNIIYGAGHIPICEALRWLAAAAPLPSDGAVPQHASPHALHLPIAQSEAAHA